MKIFIFLFASFSLPLSPAFAKSVTIEVSDVLSYQDIKAYADGTVAVTSPKVYDYSLGAETRGVAADNAAAACNQLKKMSFDYEVADARTQIRTINFTLNEDGTFSAPRFTLGGKYHTLILQKVMCK